MRNKIENTEKGYAIYFGTSEEWYQGAGTLSGWYRVSKDLMDAQIFKTKKEAEKTLKEMCKNWKGRVVPMKRQTVCEIG